jgi:murein DD-endopeptidase MepM/ murein hydrolase activator NlpD
MSLLLCLLLLIGAVFTSSETIYAAGPVAATSVTMDRSYAGLTAVGSSLQLTASPFPINNTDTMVWSTNNSGVATVDQNGRVTARGYGSARITVTAGSKSDSCLVSVISPKPAMNLRVFGLTDKLDDQTPTVQLQAQMTPFDALDTLFWSSSNPSVATVDQNGLVTAQYEGFTTILAKTSTGLAVTYEIEVTELFTPVWPCERSWTVTTLYFYNTHNWGGKHSTGSNYAFYEALDISGSGGNILAAEDGVVITIANAGGARDYKLVDGVQTNFHAPTGFGNYIEILHSNGFISQYAHLSKINVKLGDTVKCGSVIGVMGSTGSASTGLHLHFALKGADPFVDYFWGTYATKIRFTGDVYYANKRERNDKSNDQATRNRCQFVYDILRNYYHFG